MALLVAAGLDPVAGAEPRAEGVDPTRPPARRELTTDRPDATESPMTVEPGHAQVEFDAASWTRDRSEGARTVVWEVAPCNVRLGVTRSFELGGFLVPYRRVEATRPDGGRTTHAGAGDLTLRAKWNFLGNDEGAVALGLIGDLKLPTAARELGNGAVEGTVLVPVSMELGGGWGLGAMTGVDIRLAGDAGGRKGVWVSSATAGHDLTDRLAGYVELTAEIGAGAAVTTADAGLTFRLDANTQFDVGVEVGLARGADDLRVFTGLARRF